MSTLPMEKVIGKFTFKRGVHQPHRKSLSEGSAVERVEVTPGQLFVIPMIQHIGAPDSPVVERNQEVKKGDVVGEADAFVSAPVHSPVNGKVKEISAQPHPMGRKVPSVVIEAGEEQEEAQEWQAFPSDFEVEMLAPSEIVDAIRQAGCVGQGGAAFPTAVKLKANSEKPVDTILINGCECEPYLTSDHRLMIEAPGGIVAGLQLAMRCAGAEQGIIAVEDNKPDAINSLMAEIKDCKDIQLAICRTKYPQGGEKQLINAVLDRVVPTGGLPLDAGVVVLNVGTLSAIAWACATQRVVTERIVTVTGKGIARPGNFRVPVGMLLSDLLECAGGLTDDAEKVLLGGPMMGPSTPRLDVPILKGTSGITVMSHGEVRKVEATACIRCGKCIDHCPLNLPATRIAHAVKARDIEMALANDLLVCVECGCCSYICPAQIPLVQYMRSGKLMARNLKK